MVLRLFRVYVSVQTVFDSKTLPTHRDFWINAGAPSQRDALKIARRFNAGTRRDYHKSRRDDRKKRFISAVPAGRDVFPILPGVETPGYFRWFLRDQTMSLLTELKFVLGPISTNMPRRRRSVTLPGPILQLADLSRLVSFGFNR